MSYIFLGISSLYSFTVESKNEKESYIYVFQLCGDAGGIPGAGVIQVDSKKTENKPRVIGTYNLTQVIGGSKCLQIKLFHRILSFLTFDSHL